MTRCTYQEAQGSRGPLSVKDCVELERSNLFDYAENSNKRLLKAATEELQLRITIDGKNKRRTKERKTGSMERESIAWPIPKINRGDARSKEGAVVESIRVEIGN